MRKDPSGKIDALKTRQDLQRRLAKHSSEISSGKRGPFNFIANDTMFLIFGIFPPSKAMEYSTLSISEIFDMIRSKIQELFTLSPLII